MGDRVRNWHVKRYVGSAQILIDFAQSKGVEVDTCLRDTNICLSDLKDPYQEIDAEQELVMVRNIVSVLGNDPGLGLEAGLRYKLTAYGLWGFALISSRNLRQAMELGLRYLDLSYAFTGLEWEECGELSKLIISADNLPLDTKRFLLERDAAATMTMQKEIFSQSIPFKALHFTFPEPECVAVYEDVFGVIPTFSASQNQVIFESSFLDLPLPKANAQTQKMCEEQCRLILNKRQMRSGVSGKVRDLILAEPGYFPDMEEVAPQLFVTSRTLRRQLKEEGTTYRQLVEEVRQSLAEELVLIGSVTFDEISDRLGYADLSNFFHAFKRWTGMSPTLFRKDHLEG